MAIHRRETMKLVKVISWQLIMTAFRRPEIYKNGVFSVDCFLSLYYKSDQGLIIIFHVLILYKLSLILGENQCRCSRQVLTLCEQNGPQLHGL